MGTAGIWFHGPKGRTPNQHFSKINRFFEATEPKEEGLSDTCTSVALRAFVAFINLFVNVYP